MSSHGWNRRLQDTPVDLTKLQEAKEKLKALQEELSDINETSHEMHQIMRHVDLLQELLYTSKETVCDVSIPLSLPNSGATIYRNSAFPLYRKMIYRI